MAHKVFVLTFVLAHKGCTFALTLAMTSQDYLWHHLFHPDFCLGSQGLYVGLDSCHDSQDCLISKSPWLASGWSLKTSHWKMPSDAAIFNTPLVSGKGPDNDYFLSISTILLAWMLPKL
jgi:hypothetical protein